MARGAIFLRHPIMAVVLEIEEAGQYSIEYMRGCGNSSNFRPIRTDWIVNRLGWVPTPENLLSAAALFGETAYSL